MNYFICVGHAYYNNGSISSADGTEYGGVNEYKYNKELAPYIVKWIEQAGHKATLCIAPEKRFDSLDDEVNYFIGEEHKQNYDLAVQLHLNAFNSKAIININEKYWQYIAFFYNKSNAIIQSYFKRKKPYLKIKGVGSR